MTESRKPKTEMVIQLLDSALWIFLCDETAVPENRKPIVRNIGNHLMLVYSRKLLSKPYTSRIDTSFDGSMLWMLIIYASRTIQSRIASAKGLDVPPSWSYHPSFWYCEQKIVEDFLRLLRSKFEDILLLIIVWFQEKPFINDKKKWIGILSHDLFVCTFIPGHFQINQQI